MTPWTARALTAYGRPLLGRPDDPVDRGLVVDGVDHDAEDVLLAVVDHGQAAHRSALNSNISARIASTS